MRFVISFALAGLTLLALMACHSGDLPGRIASNSTPSTSAKPALTPAAAVHSDGARRITMAEVQDLLSKGQAYVVDVRNEAAYKTGHVRGAKLIPYDQIVARIKELPRDKTIVTYCS